MLLFYLKGVSGALLQASPLPLGEKELLCIGRTSKFYAKAEIQKGKQIYLSKTKLHTNINKCSLNTPPLKIRNSCNVPQSASLDES